MCVCPARVPDWQDEVDYLVGVVRVIVARPGDGGATEEPFSVTSVVHVCVCVCVCQSSELLSVSYHEFPDDFSVIMTHREVCRVLS